MKQHDVAIIGGGIVGVATARALSLRHTGSVIVLEAERELAAHQTGHNSGVIHSGLYYAPGSLKARNCVEGREALYRFCQENDVAHERCGKIVVATSEREIPALEELERRGNLNGLVGIQRLVPEQLKEHEPHVAGVAGLYVPETGIVDYVEVTRAFARNVTENGGEVRTGSKVFGFGREHGGAVLQTATGTVHARNVINCAGLQCDRIARMCGVQPGLRIVPFRGEYYEIARKRRHLVKNLIYPVPDPRFPFLGVHYTRSIGGSIEAGPNAVLAFRREGYRKYQISLKDVFSFLFYGGFWRMALKYWRMGFGEMWRSMSKGAFVRSLAKLVPELTRKDVRRGGAGVRAQALEPTGKLVDDFRIKEADRMIHVLNAPSPAATASIAIGDTIADKAVANFGLKVTPG